MRARMRWIVLRCLRRPTHPICPISSTMHSTSSHIGGNRIHQGQGHPTQNTPCESQRRRGRSGHHWSVLHPNLQSHSVWPSHHSQISTGRLLCLQKKCGRRFLRMFPAISRLIIELRRRHLCFGSMAIFLEQRIHATERRHCTRVWAIIRGHGEVRNTWVALLLHDQATRGEYVFHILWDNLLFSVIIR
jgi:hypothetical protein